MESNIISNNFTYSEFEESEKALELGIDNHIPSDKVRFAIRLLVLNLLQPLRDYLGRPVILNSGYRCRKLNTVLKGSKNSQHMKGEAADIRCENALDVLFVAQNIIRHKLPFDQMVLYSTFIHLSFCANGPQRGQVCYNKSYREAEL